MPVTEQKLPPVLDAISMQTWCDPASSLYATHSPSLVNPVRAIPGCEHFSSAVPLTFRYDTCVVALPIAKMDKSTTTDVGVGAIMVGNVVVASRSVLTF